MSIVLDQITKRYGTQLIVDRVSLEVSDGEMFVLLGASGSGKSTILRMIAGLITPDGGRIHLHGRDVTELQPQRRGTGFVFQNYSIFRHVSVAENIEFGMKIRKLPAAERKQRREKLLDLVGLGGLGNRYASQLSGGQQQRVALAVCRNLPGRGHGARRPRGERTGAVRFSLSAHTTNGAARRRGAGPVALSA